MMYSSNVGFSSPGKVPPIIIFWKTLLCLSEALNVYRGPATDIQGGQQVKNVSFLCNELTSKVDQVNAEIVQSVLGTEDF